MGVKKKHNFFSVQKALNSKHSFKKVFVYFCRHNESLHFIHFNIQYIHPSAKMTCYFKTYLLTQYAFSLPYIIKHFIIWYMEKSETLFAL